ncbi:MAG: hypothetical protein JGK24_16970 [Microcoleus sp. PH2017_29_MFU_D_A]|uniref:hypothetical protein n=1 Tax=unclassified Microcoleus TaxID=2642155 RepID=UPI001DE2ED5D|nr:MULTISPECIES: hypothetical protein [unclassified Microcoleus]MCC3440914.1 hypothetical protein [Microcoleus sp. PH2017_03_ELD_O_A]MCC3410539.1 hypothetical protein [Microcoleus sp. PH2017_02_FOX_O_A]MCC3425305.1 hypothetical protein [Microcoleus sp. PH2017_01_SCD_O_A]MCC3448835.1 hypothetical protein [Microcoleus sp. PH2017_09_SFU_O_A]MCC3457020.1 hypothetical protein [Microcoleus sp. PH2017_08_TRC_O_A]
MGWGKKITTPAKIAIVEDLIRAEEAHLQQLEQQNQQLEQQVNAERQHVERLKQWLRELEVDLDTAL